MNTDMLRIIDGICRDRNIEKEQVFVDLEQAIISAIRKMAGQTEEVECTISRSSGEITATLNDNPFDMAALGRIAAQTAKQVMIQKIREAERGSIYDEYIQRKGQIVTGTISRFEGGALVVSLGRTEGFLPRSEQIPGENHNPGERIRAMILDVRDTVHQVKIILSRTHPDLIRRLFELEVPEVGERIIEMRAMAREAGYRTKVAVSSIDSRVDAVGACVGVRGSRIRSIVDELGGEKIDIVRWNESSQILIGNALKPAEVQETALCFELNRATVVVADDQLSLAIGKRGQNVRLAARLTGWDIDILTPTEYNKGLDDMEKILRPIEGLEDLFFSKMIAMGVINLMDIEEIGIDPLLKEAELEQELAEKVLEVASENAKRIAVEMEIAKKAKREADEAKAKAEAAELAAVKLALSGGGDTVGEEESAVSVDQTEGESTEGESAEAMEADERDAEEAEEDGSAEADAIDTSAEAEEAGSVEADAGVTAEESEVSEPQPDDGLDDAEEADSVESGSGQVAADEVASNQDDVVATSDQGEEAPQQ